MKKRKGDRDRKEREGGGGALEEKDQGLWSEVNFWIKSEIAIFQLLDIEEVSL